MSDWNMYATMLGLRFCVFLCKKVVLDVLSWNNVIIAKPIKTEQNVKHIIRKAEWLGGMLVYRFTNTWYLVLYSYVPAL